MRFTLTVPDDLNSQIEGLCASQEMSKNAWVVSAITTFIEHCTTDGAEVAPLDTAVVQEAVAPNPMMSKPSGEAVRVLVIGDLHQDPRHPDRINVLLGG